MNHGSLFSGIGGFDLAAEWAGWNNVFNCDIEEFPRKILKYHFPNAIQYTDIKRTDFTVHAGAIDVLSGGFPCQPFSVAGKRQGKNDERHLWPEMYRAIQEIRPRYIVGENVRGLLSWNDGLVLDEVYADLENEGYEVLTFVLPAAGINAPHKRDRVWIIAHDTQNTMRGRLLQRKSIQEGTEIRQQWDIGSGDTNWVHREEGSNASNTISLRHNGHTQETRNNPSELSGGLVQGERHDRNQVRSQAQRCGTATSHTNNTRARESLRVDRQWSQNDQGSERQPQSEPWQEGGNGDVANTDRRSCAGKDWADFPTQSPVRSRDDGFPIGMDGITVSKWRRESIKAYGNAIVPQIAYRIFQTINKMEES